MLRGLELSTGIDHDLNRGIRADIEAVLAANPDMQVAGLRLRSALLGADLADTKDELFGAMRSALALAVPVALRYVLDAEPQGPAAVGRRRRRGGSDSDDGQDGDGGQGQGGQDGTQAQQDETPSVRRLLTPL